DRRQRAACTSGARLGTRPQGHAARRDQVPGRRRARHAARSRPRPLAPVLANRGLVPAMRAHLSRSTAPVQLIADASMGVLPTPLVWAVAVTLAWARG